MAVARRNLALVACLLAAPAPCLASEPAGMESLPSDPMLKELVDQSLAARPELKQAEATVKAEQERVPQVGALPDPILSLGIQNDSFTPSPGVNFSIWLV